jgi:hypothetical protein
MAERDDTILNYATRSTLTEIDQVQGSTLVWAISLIAIEEIGPNGTCSFELLLATPGRNRRVITAQQNFRHLMSAP